MNYEQLLLDLCNKTAKILVNLPSELNGKDVKPDQLNSKLIYPNYEQDDKKPRISEQEARFAFCHAFEKNEEPKLYYSIETPTEQKYSFSDKSGKLIVGDGRSAQSDMSIYLLNKSVFEQKINIEFKAHNVVEKQIEKDFLKLLVEQGHGLFFHLFENRNNGTCISVSKKYNNSLYKVFEAIEEAGLMNSIIKPKDKILIIVICVINENINKTIVNKIDDFLITYKNNKKKPKGKKLPFFNIEF